MGLEARRHRRLHPAPRRRRRRASTTLPVYHNWPGLLRPRHAAHRARRPARHDRHRRLGAACSSTCSSSARCCSCSPALTRDRRVVWLGAWLFFVANWVGQDYFSPQAFAFFLYLVLLGVVVRWLGARGDGEPLWARPAFALAWAADRDRGQPRPHRGDGGSAPWSRSRCGGATAPARSPIAAVVITAGWDLVLAADYVGPNVRATPRPRSGLPWRRRRRASPRSASSAPDQALVANVARGLVVAMAALAVVGALRGWREGSSTAQRRRARGRCRSVLFASGDYDGEILFRIYLFAVPFLAFLAALHLLGARGARPGGRRQRSRRSARRCSACSSFAYYGKEHQNYFTPGRGDRGARTSTRTRRPTRC